MVKLQKLDDLLLNVVVVFEARRIKVSVSGRRGCKAAGYPRKAHENKRSHTDSISPGPPRGLEGPKANAKSGAHNIDCVRGV